MEEEEITIDDLFTNNSTAQTGVDPLEVEEENEDQAVDTNAVDPLEE